MDFLTGGSTGLLSVLAGWTLSGVEAAFWRILSEERVNCKSG